MYNTIKTTPGLTQTLRKDITTYHVTHNHAWKLPNTKKTITKNY